MAKMPASMLAPDNFVFPDVPGRPFRAISIETEIDGSKTDVARSLYACGVIGTDHVMSYGTHPGEAHPHVAFLKHDSSVTCGEVIFDRIYLDNLAHAKGLRIAMEKMRQLEKKGTIAYNPNCGGHIHVDASGYGFYDLLRLMVLFGYLEEPIFRLAGAGKQYGHRSLFKGYDRAHAGRGYSNPVTKGPFTDPVVAMNSFRVQHRNSGLNITKYMAARCRSKKCNLLPVRDGDDVVDQEVEIRLTQWLNSYTRDNDGIPPSNEMISDERQYLQDTMRKRVAVDYKLCTCPKEQHTIEWRVWNAQGNPRIMFAWIALMQALHAYSWRPADAPSYREHEHKTPLGWERRPFDGSDLKYLAQAKERVEFMFTELPLRDVEKDALAYTFMRTPYKVFGRDYFRKLAQSSYKPVPYANTYVGIPVRNIGDVKELAEEAQSSPLDEARARVVQVASTGQQPRQRVRFSAPITAQAADYGITGTLDISTIRRSFAQIAAEPTPGQSYDRLWSPVWSPDLEANTPVEYEQDNIPPER